MNVLAAALAFIVQQCTLNLNHRVSNVLSVHAFYHLINLSVIHTSLVKNVSANGALILPIGVITFYWLLINITRRHQVV